MICDLALLPIQNPGYAYALNHVEFAKVQSNKIYIRCIASSLKFLWYGIWKKITCMEYGKIVFHSIPCPGYKSRGRIVLKLNTVCHLVKTLHYLSDLNYFLLPFICVKNATRNLISYCNFQG